VVLYVKRWLAASVQLPDGSLQARDRGTAQGSAVSPVLANLFMHYAFDMWLTREFPAVAFERYCDDAVIHCVTLWQAEKVLAALHERMAEVGLELHPDKTKIVYCKDTNRRGDFRHTSFTFLGYTFQPRQARRKDGLKFTAFLPAISKDALKRIGKQVRSWRLHRRTGSTAEDLAKMINPVVRTCLFDDDLRPERRMLALPTSRRTCTLLAAPTGGAGAPRRSPEHAMPLGCDLPGHRQSSYRGTRLSAGLPRPARWSGAARPSPALRRQGKRGRGRPSGLDARRGRT
jgi:hypothetical protein